MYISVRAVVQSIVKNMFICSFCAFWQCQHTTTVIVALGQRNTTFTRHASSTASHPAASRLPSRSPWYPPHPSLLTIPCHPTFAAKERKGGVCELAQRSTMKRVYRVAENNSMWSNKGEGRMCARHLFCDGEAYMAYMALWPIHEKVRDRI